MSKPPLNLPMAVVKSFVDDMNEYWSEPNAVSRAEIAERQLTALQQFLGPRDKKLRLRDVIALFEEMRGPPLKRRTSTTLRQRDFQQPPDRLWPR
jgi:hypothetical protein